MDDRRDDWRRGVDENLASLNAGQRIWEREFGSIRKLSAEIDKLLRGDPDRDTDGIIARLHQQENAINMLKALVLKDTAGNIGLIARVEALESGERTSGNRWQFATAVTVAVISLLGLLMTNWERLEAILSRESKDPVTQMINRAKHPRKKKAVYRVVPAPPPAVPQEGGVP